MNITYSKNGQAMPSGTEKIDADAFNKSNHTSIRWLSGAGIMINSRGTILFIDPLLEGFDMPLLVNPPIESDEVARADAVLITHIDNDHYSKETCKAIEAVTQSYHSTNYVAGEMQKSGINGIGHDINESFSVGNAEVKLTPALHNWQNYMPDKDREYLPEDYCGYYITTEDGSIWLPGDSKLIDEHLNMPSPDVILFDFSDNEWHITFDGAVKLANTYPMAKLICIHWGTVDAPEFAPFNADPNKIKEKIINPERLFALIPGEEFVLE